MCSMVFSVEFIFGLAGTEPDTMTLVESHDEPNREHFTNVIYRKINIT